MKLASFDTGAAKRPPTLGEFDLPDNFDFEHHEEELRRLKLLSKRATWSIPVGLGAFSFLLGPSDIDLTGHFIGFLTIWWFSAIGMAVLNVEKLFEKVIVFQSKAGRFKRRVDAFIKAKENWEYFNATTGPGFWKALRGIELENAVARLFRERGWQAEETALTGDGGVDLKLNKGAVQLWVQCKGYAKPVSVAAVREIAGVCSASNAEPMLVVVNGITKPAQAEASAYSVTVWDSRELACFARGEDHF